MGEVVTVVLVGGIAVDRGGRRLSGVDIGSRKARTLLSLLAVDFPHAVLTSRIVDVLWGNAPPRHPAGNVATLVSRLRASLGDDVVGVAAGGYRLGPAVTTDLAEADRLVSRAETWLRDGQGAVAAVAAGRAVELLTGGEVAADGPDAEWARPARMLRADRLRRARLTCVEAALRQGGHGNAVTMAQLAVDELSLDEEATRLLMRAYQAAGMPGHGLKAYERLQDALAEELGVDPAPQTRAMHLALLREQAIAETSPAVAPPNPRQVRLAGRDVQVAQVKAAWNQAVEGAPGLLVIVGEAGIGKTRLAATAAEFAESSGALVGRARCHAAERSLFLMPVAEALMSLLDQLPPATVREVIGDAAGVVVGLVPMLAPILGVPPDRHDDPEVQRRRVFEAVAHLLANVTSRRPVLLFLDDVHNAGVAVLELVHFLSRRVGRRRLLIVATARSEESGSVRDVLADVAQWCEVGPLASVAIATLAASAGVPHLAREVERRTAGHTLSVVELLEAMAGGDQLVPASLREAVLTRVTRAGEEVGRLLRCAAILGPTFDPIAVAALLDIAPADSVRRCEALLAARLVTVAGHVYEFANEVIQEIVYAATPTPTRVALHRRAADLLKDNPEAEAAHAAAAGDWARAALAYGLAGERALQRWAVADARALLDQALHAADHASDDAARGRLLLMRGHARTRLGGAELAVDDYAAALSVAQSLGDRRLAMQARRELGGPTAVAAGMPIGAVSGHVDEALRLAELLGDRGAQADTLGWLAVLHVNQLRFDIALQFGQRAVEVARSSGEDRGIALALDGIKSVHAYLGHIRELTKVLDELEPLLRRLDDRFLLQWCLFESAFPHVAVGGWTEATACIVAAHNTNIEAWSGHGGSWFVAHQGWVARLAGDLPTAVRLGRQALDLPMIPWWRGAVPAMLATTLLECGEVEEAIGLLEASLEALAPQNTEAYVLRCLAPLAEATGAVSVLDVADGALRAITTPPGSAWLYGMDSYVSVARAWFARGDAGRAHEILAPLLDAACSAGWIAPSRKAWELANQCRAALGLTGPLPTVAPGPARDP